MATDSNAPDSDTPELITIRTRSATETQAVAARLAPLLRPSDVLTLSGDLGAGKTTFTRGLVAALGVPENAVTSPTFALLHEYRGGKYPVYHADAYRLSHPADADEIGLMEVVVTGDGITVVEWAEHILAALPSERLEIALDDTGGEERTLRIVGRGARWENFNREWHGAC